MGEGFGHEEWVSRPPRNQGRTLSYIPVGAMGTRYISEGSCREEVQVAHSFQLYMQVYPSNTVPRRAPLEPSAQLHYRVQMRASQRQQAWLEQAAMHAVGEACTLWPVVSPQQLARCTVLCPL